MGLKNQLNRHPSAGCKQQLSTQEQVERTQVKRVQHQLRKIQREA